MKPLSHFARYALLYSMIGAAVPATLLAGGCGGGQSGGIPNPSSYKLAATLTYSGISQNSNAFVARIDGFDTTRDDSNGELSVLGNQQKLALSGVNRIVNNTTERRLTLELASPSGRKFEVGQVIPLALGTSSNILLRQSVANTGVGGDRIWNSDGGSAVITSIGPDSIGLRLDNAYFVPSPAFLGQGTFLLNGPINATGLRVTNN